MRLRLPAVLLLLAFGCSDPPCAEGERKVGSVCLAVPGLDAGAAPAGPQGEDGLTPGALPATPDGADAGSWASAPGAAAPTSERSFRIEAAWNATCAFFATGDARCWGDSFPTSGTSRLKPEPTPVLMQADSFWQRDAVACARFPGNQLKCWGRNSYGEVGDGTQSPRLTPVLPPDLGNVQAASIGTGHVCALLAAGGVKCWGADGVLGNIGQLGTGLQLGPPRKMQLAPQLVAGTEDATALSTGREHSCVRRAGGTVQCWGANYWGQLGDGTRESRGTPKDVTYVYDAVDVRVGGAQTCVLTKSRLVSCWDYKTTFSPEEQKTPGATAFPLAELADVTALALGAEHGCALHSSGVVSCWGSNTNGQLGDGTIVTRKTPAQVPALNGVVQLVAGNYHNCARLQSGEVRCWGDNQYGQLGDGTTTSRLTPVRVLALP